MAQGQRLRLGRISIPGQIYHITTVTKDRNPLFSKLENARVVVKTLKHLHDSGEVECLCFVVMPDHLHFLFELGERKDLSTVVQKIKSMVSKELGGPVWQRGFHDHALRCEEDIQNLARYIVANPVRAGLVKSVREYPHWDAIWL